MKKIFWLIILLGTGYIVSIFLAPNIADQIGDLFGIKSINEQIRNSGGDLSKISTNIPSSDELQKTYNDSIKKAGDFKDTVVGGIEKTKEIIDTTRATLSGAEDTYNKAKETIDETLETVDKLKKTFNDVEKMGEQIQNVVNTGAIK